MGVVLELVHCSRPDYGMAKLGLYGLTRTLALEGRKNNILITAMGLVENIVPPAKLTEGLTWMITGLGMGVALGAVLTADAASGGAVGHCHCDDGRGVWRGGGHRQARRWRPVPEQEDR